MTGGRERGGIDNTIKNVEERERERKGSNCPLYQKEKKKTPSAEREKFWSGYTPPTDSSVPSACAKGWFDPPVSSPHRITSGLFHMPSFFDLKHQPSFVCCTAFMQALPIEGKPQWDRQQEKRERERESLIKTGIQLPARWFR